MSGLLPTIPGPGDGRYAAGTRTKSRPWTIHEDAALWPPLLACESEGAYVRTCKILAGLLEREPRFASGRPTEAEFTGKAVSLIERRTVTEVLGDRDYDLRVWVGSQSPYTRTGATTWAERNRFYRPWSDKPTRKEPRCSKEALLLLVARAAHDTSLDEWEAVRSGYDPGDRDVRPPAECAGFREVFLAAVGGDCAPLWRFCFRGLPGW